MVTDAAWILAVDLGAHAGWAAYHSERHLLRSGAWSYAKKTRHGPGQKFLQFESALESIAREFPPSRLVYEEPQKFRQARVNRVMGGYEAIVQRFCERGGIPYGRHNPKTIKKHATGSGNAEKEAIVEVAQEKWPDQLIRTHDQADALWLLDLELVSLGLVTI